MNYLSRFYRQTTWRIRALPDFIVIGAQRSGTTSLHSYLGQHPQLCPSIIKEVHYFDGGLNPGVDTYELGEKWYRIHFPYQSKAKKSCQRVYESSPLYIFNPLAPSRIHDLIPNVRLIAVLRNPTDRAVSHYWKMVRSGFETLPLEAALKEEELRLASAIEKQDFKNEHFIYHSYKARGLYKNQIDKYLSYFPMEQILIMNMQDLFSCPLSFLRKIFKFVGVDENYKIKDLTPRNATPNKQKLEPDLREYLDAFFRPHNAALYESIHQDFDW